MDAFCDLKGSGVSLALFLPLTVIAVVKAEVHSVPNVKGLEYMALIEIVLHGHVRYSLTDFGVMPLQSVWFQGVAKLHSVMLTLPIF